MFSLQLLILLIQLLLQPKLTTSFYSTNHNARLYLSASFLSTQQQRRQHANVISPLPSKTKSSLSVQSKSSDNKVAYPQQTPHSGCHFTPTIDSSDNNNTNTSNDKISNKSKNRKRKLRQGQRRFMEGWYYRITLPKEKISFAIIMSIEDPGISETSNLTLAACQIMGPNDEYLIQGTKNDSRFWALQDSQGLGCTFDFSSGEGSESVGPIAEEEFEEKARSGFQVLPNKLQGKIIGHDGCDSHTNQDIVDAKGVPGNCTFDINIEPLIGWGGNLLHQQRSTAGWLASYPVFEPHWQVTLADARASGRIEWNGVTYQFENQPFYAEKNWGGTFPTKWYWIQCNSFNGYDEDNQLSLTAGGGIRELPLFRQKEEVGLIGIHYRNIFYEAVPWTGSMSWDIAPWGRWILKGRCTSGGVLFESEVIATCVAPGVVLRAPTCKDGLVYFCRDSFYANVTLSLWPLEWDISQKKWIRGQTPIVDGAKSSQAAVEVGGGPWWTSWKGASDMKQPMRGLVRFPYWIQGAKRRLRSFGRSRR